MNKPGEFNTGIARDRIIAVVVELQDGREQVGSGFLLDGRLVLTAKHCTHDMITGEPPRNIRVIRASDGVSADQIKVMSSQALDVALLELIEAPWDEELERPILARIDRALSGVLRDCTSMGYPLYQYDPNSHDRRTAELHGIIYQTDEAESGRLLLREPLLEGVAVPSASNNEASGNPWGGLSGAAVFYAGFAIGIIVEHHPRQGSSAVQLISFDQLVEWSDTDPGTRQVATALGVASLESLELVSANRLGNPLDSILAPSPAAIYPFEILDSESSIFGNPYRSSLIPSFEEYLSGSINPGVLANKIDEALTNNSVLLLGRGAVGKTTLSAWIGVKHNSQGGQSYYLDLAKINTSEVSQLAPRLLDILTSIISRQSLIILDNSHRNPDLAATLHRQWRRSGSPGRFLITARVVHAQEHPEPDRNLVDIVGYVEELVLTEMDLVHTFSRITKQRHTTNVATIPVEAPRSWLSLFSSDRMAFALAVRRHLEAEGLERWIKRRRATLTPGDAISYVRERYLDRWPSARSELIKLAAAASIELALPEDTVVPALLDEPLRAGILQQTTHSETYRRYSFIHPGLGSLVLTACSIDDVTPIFSDIAIVSPYWGFLAAARLESIGEDSHARIILHESCRSSRGILDGLTPKVMMASLQRLDRLGVLSMREVDSILAQPDSAKEAANRVLRYSLTEVLTYFRVGNVRLPQFFEALRAHLYGDDMRERWVAAIVEDCTANLGETITFLRELRRLTAGPGQPVADEIVARLDTSDGITQIADACDKNLGQTIDFLRQLRHNFGDHGRHVADEIVARLDTSDGITRIADASATSLGDTTKFLRELSRLSRGPGRHVANEVVARLDTSDGITRIADACATSLGQTIDFLRQLRHNFGDHGRHVADEVVARLDTSDGITRIADACATSLGETITFLRELPQLSRGPGRHVANEVVARLDTSDGITRIADACATSLGQTIDFLRQLRHNFGDHGRHVADEVVARLDTSDGITRIADACATSLGDTITFLRELPQLSPGPGRHVADEVVARLDTSDGITRIADACATDLGHTNTFLRELPRLSPGPGRHVADEVVARLDTSDGVTQIADAFTDDLFDSGVFLEGLSRRSPLLMGKILKLLMAPGRVDGLARAHMLDPLRGGRFITQTTKRCPTLTELIVERESESSLVDTLAAKIIADSSGLGIRALRSYWSASPELFNQLIESIEAQFGPDALARLVTDNLDLSGWLIRVLKDNYSGFKEALFPIILANHAVHSYASSSIPSWETAADFRTLITIAQELESIDNGQAINIIRSLLGVFRYGYHLGSKVYLRDLSSVISLTGTSYPQLADDTCATLRAVSRSGYWLEREFLTCRRWDLVDSMDRLWWSAAQPEDVRAVGAAHLESRVADELAVLRMVNRTPATVADVLRLISLAPKYQLATLDASQLISTQQLQQVIDEAFTNPTSSQYRIQILSGLQEAHRNQWITVVPPVARTQAVEDCQSMPVLRHRSDQETARSSILGWFASLF